VSTRAHFYAVAAKPKLLAEEENWIPLCWLSLLSVNGVRQAVKDSDFFIKSARKDAIAGCAASVPFLAELFPKFQSFEACANELLAVLRKNRAATVGVEMHDHFAMQPYVFPSALAAAVEAIEARDAKRPFTRPAEEIRSPFTGKTTKVKATSMKTTRDLLCCVTGIDPRMVEDGLERDMLIGQLTA